VNVGRSHQAVSRPRIRRPAPNIECDQTNIDLRAQVHAEVRRRGSIWSEQASGRTPAPPGRALIQGH
jgi:hypothetical protein